MSDSSRSPYEAQIHPDAWIAPGAVVVGRVRLGRASSVWYGCVVRGDEGDITIGEECNIQDLSCLSAEPSYPTTLEPRVSVGHQAVIHGAYIEEGSLISIGAKVLTGARVGAGSIVAAGAVLERDTPVPPRSVVAGVPAKVLRKLTEEDMTMIADTPDSYVAKSQRHREIGWS